MSTTSHAHALRRVIERYVEINRTGDTSTLGEIIAPDFRVRLAAPIGVEGVAAFVRVLHTGFTEIACSIEQCVCDEEWASFRYAIAGTHTGVFAGRAATGRRIAWEGADFMRLRDGKIIQLWPVQESLPLMEGLGSVARVPAP
jgi:predicted ester cyclase